jgi:sterol desaturase/sphingolipid hydroxylase (fatty acid hydroxylase superfamily)
MRLDELIRSTGEAALFLLAVVLLIHLAERRNVLSTARYRTKHFANDVVYGLVYRGGLYNMFVWSAVANALDSKLSGLKLNVLSDVPFAVALAVYWVVGDFLLYWFHRWQHTNRLLWALHSVHHGQEQLNTLTQYRRHPLEMLYIDVVMFTVFVIVLGVPTTTWLPLYMIMSALQALQHAELEWRLGPLHRVVVSPAFHAQHHSTDPAHYNRNFGILFSTWDFLFGTAVASERRPKSFGVAGLKVPESLVDQCVLPFRIFFAGRSLGPAGLARVQEGPPTEGVMSQTASTDATIWQYSGNPTEQQPETHDALRA